MARTRLRQLVRARNSVSVWLRPVSCEPRIGPRQAALAGVAAPIVMAAARAVPATMHKIRFLVIPASDVVLRVARDGLLTSILGVSEAGGILRGRLRPTGGSPMMW